MQTFFERFDELSASDGSARLIGMADYIRRKDEGDQKFLALSLLTVLACRIDATASSDKSLIGLEL